jgi:hypothetical protein
MSNLNAAIEEMARTIRVGSYYHCGTLGSITTTADCSSGDTYFGFLPSGGDSSLSGNRTVYRFNESTHQIERSLDSGINWIGITAPEVTVNTLKFYAVGTTVQRADGDANQPRVLIVIDGVAGLGAGLESPFSLETMVSQRLLDI